MTAPADSMPLLLTQVISRNRRTCGGAALVAPERLDRFAIRRPLFASVSGQTFEVIDDACEPPVPHAARLFTSRYTEYVGAGIPSLAALAAAAQPAVGALPRLHAATRVNDNLLLVFGAPAGQPLDQLLMGAAGTLPVATAKTMVAQLARGIASLHGFGYVHGDLRPSTLFVDPEAGTLVLADWGHTIPTHLSMSDSGAVVGHAFDGVAYASGEVLAGSPPRREDDVWSIGCIAYEMLAGRHPFDRRTATDVAAADLRPAPIEALDERCNALLASALASRRSDRTVSLSEIAAAFGGGPSPREVRRDPAPSTAASRPARERTGVVRGRRGLVLGALSAMLFSLALVGFALRGPPTSVAVAPAPAADVLAMPVPVPPTGFAMSRNVPAGADAPGGLALPRAVVPVAVDDPRALPARDPVAGPSASAALPPAGRPSIATEAPRASVAQKRPSTTQSPTMAQSWPSSQSSPSAQARTAQARAAHTTTATRRPAKPLVLQQTAACPTCDCVTLREKRYFSLEPMRDAERAFLARSCRG